MFFMAKRALEDGCGKLCCATGAEHIRLGAGHYRISPAVEVIQASISQLELSKFEGCLARKLRFSHLQPSDFEGSLARKLRFSHLPLSLFQGSLARNTFFAMGGRTKFCLLQGKTCLGRWTRKLCRVRTAKRSHSSKDVSQQRELTASLTAKGSHSKEIS